MNECCSSSTAVVRPYCWYQLNHSDFSVRVTHTIFNTTSKFVPRDFAFLIILPRPNDISEKKDKNRTSSRPRLSRNKKTYQFHVPAMSYYLGTINECYNLLLIFFVWNNGVETTTNNSSLSAFRECDWQKFHVLPTGGNLTFYESWSTDTFKCCKLQKRETTSFFMY